MEQHIVIVGAGFASRQLVKNLRRSDERVKLTLITADSGDEYHKPDLSHVFSLKQSADSLTRQSAVQFAHEYHLDLRAYTSVTGIHRSSKEIAFGTQRLPYHKLVLATGAQARIPDIPGSEWLVTFSSQQEYHRHQTGLQQARSIVVLGGGLIGTELAMDLHRAGKQVMLIGRAESLLPSLLPAELSSRLQQKCRKIGIQLFLNDALQSIHKTAQGFSLVLEKGLTVQADAVIAAVGLIPNIRLAAEAGLATLRGICVDDRLQTSDPDIYALGDVAEINGRTLPFLQPIQLGAMALAKNLLGDETHMPLPALLVKVKTPELPLVLAGDALRPDLEWDIKLNARGMLARGNDAQQRLCAFVTSEEYTAQAFGLLRDILP